MKALIVIDYTNDFVATDGKLTCGEPGQKLERKIAQLVREYANRGDLVVFANDLHKENDPYHPETKLFPPHNIEGTDGRHLYGQVADAYNEVNHLPNVISFDKTRYSAFAGTPLSLLLNERNIKEISLVGVCTDICILHTAVDAYNYGYQTTIYKDGVASFNESGHHWALTHFESSLGSTII